jgi:hypothetical protein
MFPQFFYIIPSTILPHANPNAPNSSKRGRIVEELWKNCRKMLRVLVLQVPGKNCRRIVEIFCAWTCARKIFLQFFYNSSTIFSRRLPDEGTQILSTIIPQLFPAGSLA